MESPDADLSVASKGRGIREVFLYFLQFADCYCADCCWPTGGLDSQHLVPSQLLSSSETAASSDWKKCTFLKPEKELENLGLVWALVVCCSRLL